MSIGNRKIGYFVYLELNDAAFLEEERGETSMSKHLREIVKKYVESQKSLQNSKDNGAVKLTNVIGSTAESC